MRHHTPKRNEQTREELYKIAQDTDIDHFIQHARLLMLMFLGFIVICVVMPYALH